MKKKLKRWLILPASGWSSNVRLRKRKSLICLFIFSLNIFLAIQLRTILMGYHLQPLLKSTFMCNVYLMFISSNIPCKVVNIRLRIIYFVQFTVIYFFQCWEDGQSSLKHDLRRCVHTSSPVASPAARWPAVPVSPTGLIWSTPWAIVIVAGADSWTGIFDVAAPKSLRGCYWVF